MRPIGREAGGGITQSGRSLICTIALLLLVWSNAIIIVVKPINVKKLQFIHSVNGDGSKTAKIIKRQC